MQLAGVSKSLTRSGPPNLPLPISTSSSVSLTASAKPTTTFDLTRLLMTKRPHHAGLPQRAPIQSASHHLSTRGTSKSAASATPEPSDSTRDNNSSHRHSTANTSGSRKCKTASGTSSTTTLYSDVSTNETKPSPGHLLSEPPRVFRRAHYLRGWAAWEDQVGTHRRFVRGRCGWFWTRGTSTVRSGRRSSRYRRRSAVRPRRCVGGSVRRSTTRACAMA